jgi:hypothetical protein
MKEGLQLFCDWGRRMKPIFYLLAIQEIDISSEKTTQMDTSLP